MPVIVSNLDFSCRTVHVGVTRRSVRKRGSGPVAVLGVVTMTETSVGEGWNAITDVIEADQLYGGQPMSEFYMLSTMKGSQLKS